jgi:OOP family OmpA-OmpF porin
VNNFNLWEFPVNNTKKIALAVAILCSAGVSLAQEINPSWYVQPTVVGIKTDRDFGVDDKSWGGGLRFGKPVHPLWDIQFGATHVNADSGPNSLHQTLAGVDALLMLSRKTFRPFVLFGVGAERDKVSGPGRSIGRTNPYAALGVGFQVALNDRWSLQADVRTVRAWLDRDDFGFSKSNSKYLTLGVNYAFNPPPAPPPPAPAPAAAVIVEQPAPPPPPPPPPPAKFEKVVLSAVELFDFNSATLRMPQPKLDDIASVLVADPTITDVDINGYTDRIGSDKYNLKLSQRRADAVRDYLVSKGVDGSRLKAHGLGKANPVAECHQKKRSELIACLAPNRRVEVEQITIEKRVQ